MSLLTYNLPDVQADTSNIRVNPYIINGDVFTMSAWFKKRDVSRSNDTVFSGCGYQNTSNCIRFGVDSGRAYLRVNGSSNNAFSPANAKNDIWQHVCGVQRSDTNRQAYLDAIPGTIATTSATATNTADAMIGGNDNTDSGFEGFIAELAAWNVVLTDAEIFSLSKGYSPRIIRRQNLIFYMPLRAQNQGFSDLMNKSRRFSVWDTGKPRPELSPDHPPVSQNGVLSKESFFMPKVFKPQDPSCQVMWLY